jgi:predicted RNase H-like HicB family nuclease
MKPEKILLKVLSGSKNIKFTEFVHLVEAFGKSRQDALTEVEIAKEVWLEAAKREKKPIPKPRYKPVIYQMSA